MPDARLRVALVAAASTGGIGRHVRLLSERLGERDVSVTVCAPAPTLAALGPWGASTRLVPVPVGSLGPRALVATRTAIRRAAGEVDVVHAHGLRAGAVAGAFCGSTPLAVTWHNAVLGGPVWRIEHRVVAQYAARAADLTLAASPDLVAAARRAGARRVRDVFVAAPELGAATRPAEQIRAALDVGKRPVVLAIGRLQTQKRFEVLVAATAGWGRDQRSPIVLIAGSGPEHDALAEQIARSDAPVRLLGARDDVADLLAIADVVALPSEWEARALVAQEAFRAGVPLVTTPVGGLPSLLGTAAEFVAVGDSVALGVAIMAVLSDPSRSATLAAAGHAQAATWPTTARTIDDLMETYLDLSRTSRPE